MDKAGRLKYMGGFEDDAFDGLGMQYESPSENLNQST